MGAVSKPGEPLSFKTNNKDGKSSATNLIAGIYVANSTQGRWCSDERPWELDKFFVVVQPTKLFVLGIFLVTVPYLLLVRLEPPVVHAACLDTRAGGVDEPSNMRWQNTADAIAKDKWERKP